jgi:hypothetical protein
MKSIMPYIVLFVGSFIVVSLVMGGMLMFKPELFGIRPHAAAASADSTHAPVKKALKYYGPSLADLRGQDVAPGGGPQITALMDSLTQVNGELHRTRAKQDSLQAALAGVAVKQPAVEGAPADTTHDPAPDRVAERKAVIKMLGSMEAESAARLLKGMSDKEAKELLLHLKTKQAAKILAALDPERAAKLIR